MSDWEKIAAHRPLVLVLMGVSGCGKSTVAAMLAGRLHWEFEEGDSLHPAANIEKMAAGHPLTDADRMPWLALVADWIEGRLDAGENGVITCSALRRSYREIVNRRNSGVLFVYLAGSRELIESRMAARQGHFMPTALLDSQFATLEAPGSDEPAISVAIGRKPKAIAKSIITELHLTDVPTSALRALKPRD
ncbi:gluconokinase [Leifsonia kafniensis]|uniref:Gluconokinase n=1 Tax=Leifsonia kafniensis TaxID=475957 RepID=A0ABP7KFM6_9MICO